MSIFSFRKTYKNLVRVTEIIQVLSKHGFGHIISQLNLPGVIPSLRQIKPSSKISIYLPEDTMAVRARLAFQELGPTFVKLGQIFSGRPDIFPPDFIKEFKKLQDEVPPFPIEQALATIEQELGAPAEEVFPFFSRKVLASGSIGQAHEASLPDGTEVIVKIVRPGIERIIATDIAILKFLAELLEKYVEETRMFQPRAIVDEFAKGIRKELDFTLEASYCEKFYNLLHERKEVYSPKIFWQYTTPKLITLEKLKGTNIDEVELLEKQGIDPKLIAQNLTSSFMEQYFVWGLFHADPHPGNILVSQQGVVQLIDFGSVGHLSNELKGQLSTIVLALMDNDLDLMLEVYSDIGVFTENINPRALKADILEIIDKYFNTPFEHLNLKNVFEDIIQISRTHKVILPKEFIVFAKSLITVTSVAQTLDPQFNLAKAASPHLSAIIKEKFSFKRIYRMSFVSLWSLTSLLYRLPAEMKELLRRLRAGSVQFTIRHTFRAQDLNIIEKAFNRLALAIIMGCTLISASLLIVFQIGPDFHGISVLGLMGYLLATFLGVLMIWSMAKSGRI